MRRLRTYLALTPAARRVVLRNLVLLPAVALLLRARGMARTQAVLERTKLIGERDYSELSPGEITRLVDAAAALLRIPCLPRTLVLWHLLGHRRASAVVRLGVSKLPDGRLSAHAWLELDGLPLNDRADVFERYAALPAAPKQTPC